MGVRCSSEAATGQRRQDNDHRGRWDRRELSVPPPCKRELVL
jgi:hypothetical protein